MTSKIEKGRKRMKNNKGAGSDRTPADARREREVHAYGQYTA